MAPCRQNEELATLPETARLQLSQGSSHLPYRHRRESAYACAMANPRDWATEDELTTEPMPASTRVPPPPPRPPAPPTTGGTGSGNEDYAVGDAVRVVDGPFADFPGTITEIDSDSRWLQIVIRIFERETPVRLETSQISRRQDRPRPEM
jgi:hypothetical protein